MSQRLKEWEERSRVGAINMELQRAVSRGDPEAVKAALARGANPNGGGGEGKPLVLMAASGGQWMQGSAEARERILEELLLAGASPNQSNEAGQSSVLTASFFGDVEAARRLIKAGADASLADRRGDTAAHYIAAATDAERGGLEHVELARALFEAGADFGAKNNAGQTPIDRARSRGQGELAEAMEAWRQREELEAVTGEPGARRRPGL